MGLALHQQHSCRRTLPSRPVHNQLIRASHAAASIGCSPPGQLRTSPLLPRACAGATMVEHSLGCTSMKRGVKGTSSPSTTSQVPARGGWGKAEEPGGKMCPARPPLRQGVSGHIQRRQCRHERERGSAPALAERRWRPCLASPNRLLAPASSLLGDGGRCLVHARGAAPRHPPFLPTLSPATCAARLQRHRHHAPLLDQRHVLALLAGSQHSKALPPAGGRRPDEVEVACVGDKEDCWASGRRRYRAVRLRGPPLAGSSRRCGFVGRNRTLPRRRRQGGQAWRCIGETAGLPTTQRQRRSNTAPAGAWPGPYLSLTPGEPMP